MGEKKANWEISIFKENSKEYKKLSDFAEMLTDSAPDNYEFYVDDFYFDAGQNWMWTSILKRNKNESGTLATTWVLYPTQQKDILEGRNLERIKEDILSKLEDE